MASLRYAVYGADASGQSWQHCAPFPDEHEAWEAAFAFWRMQYRSRGRYFFVLDVETGEPV